MASVGTSAPVPGETQLERRAVGLPTSIGTTFGLITAGTIMLSVGQGFSASYVFLVALVIALFTMYLQSMSFSELATMIPKAGSMNEYVRAGLGTFFATLTVLVGYVAIQVFPASAEASLFGNVVENFLWSGLTVNWWVVIMVGFVALLNLGGIRPFAVIEVSLTFVIAASLLIFGFIGIVGAGSGDTVQGLFPDVPFTWSLLSALLGLAIFTFVGVEYTCPLAEELRRPERDIPWGIFIGLTLVFVPITLFGFAAVRYVPLDQLGDPAQITHMNAAVAVLGDTGKWWIGLVSVFAAVTTLNAALAGISRILYGMALTGQLPRVFGYLTPATRAPAAGIILLALAPILVNVTGFAGEADFIEFILAGVLGWATAYFLIHLAQISLRLREPDARRPYRSPLFPIPQLVGMGLLALAAFKIFPDPEIREDIYVDYGIFLAAAAAFSLAYNFWIYRSAAIFRPVPLRDVYLHGEGISEPGAAPVTPPPPPSRQE